MDLGLTEVQQMLKNSAREFLSRECPLTLVREMEEDALGHTGGLWQQVVNLGWTGLAVPEQYGGTGGDFMALAVLLEETGRALLPGPLTSTAVLGGLTVLDAGSDAQKQDILPGICSGRTLMTLAFTEPSASLEPVGIETTATPDWHGGRLTDWDTYLLKGTKLFVPDAHTANLLLVVARTAPVSENDAAPEQGITVFLVDAGSPGVGLRQLNSIASDRLCEVTLDDVRVSPNAVLGGVGQGWPIVQRAIQRGITAQCVQMVGGADAVLDLTVEYVKQRTQFGRPVGSFQAVQHHCSNMATDVDGSRHIAYQAAWRLSQGLPADREVAMAKAWVSGAYQRVCATAHQCHGAIGFTKEHNLQLYTRRAKVQELSYGDAHFHKELALQHIDD